MIIIFYNKILLPTKLWGTGFAKCMKVAFPAPREWTVSAGDGTCHTKQNCRARLRHWPAKGTVSATGSQGWERAEQYG